MNSNEEYTIGDTSELCLTCDRQNVGESKKRLAVELLRIRSHLSDVSPDIDGALELAVSRGMLIGRREVGEVLRACREWLECNDGEPEDYTDLNVGEEEAHTRWFAECLLGNNTALLDEPNLESVSGHAAGSFDIWLCTEEIVEVLAVCRNVLAHRGSDLESYTETAINELKDSVRSCLHVAPSA